MVGSYWVCHWKETFQVRVCDGIGGLEYLLFCAAYWSRQPRVFQRLSHSCPICHTCRRLDIPVVISNVASSAPFCQEIINIIILHHPPTPSHTPYPTPPPPTICICLSACGQNGVHSVSSTTLSGSFHIFTSYQAISEVVSRVKVI